ncbi:MAG: sigma 54-interacting transcriptional regulator [Deltaproteobacteria bacterium]|nr:sigma 54-interacting transcriptional regulator [Deltaproteobacteria bacterium]
MPFSQFGPSLASYLKNVPTTLQPDSALEEVAEYFLQSPDFNTAVVLDRDASVWGVVKRNDLFRLALTQDLTSLGLEAVLTDSYQAASVSSLNKEWINSYLVRSTEDLVVLDEEDKFLTLATRTQLAELNYHSEASKVQLLQAVLNTCHPGLVAVDRECRILLFNQTAADLLGVQAEEVIGRKVREAIPDSRLPIVIETGKPETSRNFRIGTGSFMVYRNPIQIEGRTVAAMAQFIEGSRWEDPLREMVDITELTNLLKIVMDNAYVGLIFCDAKGKIRYMNRMYEELLGVGREETYGRHITKYFADSRVPLVIETGVPEIGWKYRYHNQQTLVVHRIPIRTGAKIIGALVQCIFKDLSELKDMATKMDVLENKVASFKSQLSSLLSPKYCFMDILGSGQLMRDLKRQAQLFAQSDTPVLVTGETGTGKELIAHAIHSASARHEGPFVCINCASIPGELLESELFGYAPGAFTGASQRGKPGKITLANEGTLFLDEVGDMPIPVQAKLLRVLEDRKVDRVGGTHPVEVNFRLVAATNQDLGELIRQKVFREDLFYRLATAIIKLPPLRERIEDLAVLVRHFIKQSTQRPIGITDEACALLINHRWPGNIRELRGVVERALTLLDGAENIEPHHLDLMTPEDMNQDSARVSSKDFHLKRIKEEEERETIIRALQFCDGNKSRAAKLLKISRSMLYAKINRYEISVS